MPNSSNFSSEYDYYIKRQSFITKENWKRGIYNFLIKPLEIRYCKNPDCNNTFSLKPGNPQVFCSHSCSAHTNNMGRGLSLLTRSRISKSILSLPKSTFQRQIKARVELTCLACKKKFKVVPYLSKNRKYCSNLCSITTTGK